ncbi:hypothetical protein MXD81_31150 [Microbacteriaceae bacterium K1510]|nr:hypothetical protein [Microbacteriaceae bacterium K1510]
MGVKLLAMIAIGAALAAPIAFAQGTVDEGLRDCEKLAAVKFKRDNPAFKKFAIDHESAEQDKFTDKVGSQFVSSVYHGKATYQAAGEAESVRFICLHAGFGKGAVFVYTLSQ